MRNRRRRLLAMAAAATFVGLHQQRSWAQATYAWDGANGTWTDTGSNNWTYISGNVGSPAVPGSQPGDTALVTNVEAGGASSQNIVLNDNNVSAANALAELLVDADGGTNTETLSMPNNDTFNATSEYVGDGVFGNGVISQGAGTNAVGNGGLFVGNNAEDFGAYILGAGALSVTGANQYAGYQGYGNFVNGGAGNGVGGANTISGNLYLGYGSASYGSYDLLANQPSPNNGSAGYLSVTGDEYVGYQGSATFFQTGGSNTVTGNLFIGYQSPSIGTYNISGGYNNSGNFYPAMLNVGGTIYIGDGTSGGENNVANGNVTSGIGALKVGVGCVVTSGAIDVLDPAGTILNLEGGEISTSDLDFNNDPSLFSWTSGTLDLTGPGNLVVDTGANANFSSSFTLGAGMFLNVSASEVVGDLGTGTVTQTGGSNSILGTNDLVIGNVAGAIGTYTLSGGALAVSGNAYVGGSASGPGGTGVLTASNSGQLSVTGTLTVFNSGRVNINGGSAVVGGLSIPGSGVVNVNAFLAINYGAPANDPISAIKGYLTTGYNGGNWAGTSGIISTNAAASVGHSPLLCVGYADGNDAYDLGKVSGLHPNQIFIVYTVAGDANLDGTVNFADLLIVAQNFNKSGEDWVGGNFIYSPNGLVNFADLLIVAQNFNRSLNPFDSPLVSVGGNIVSLTVKIPEPSALALTIGAGAGLLARRRRKIA